MKKIIGTTILMLTVLVGFSQTYNTSSSYKTAIGLKVYPGGISVKHFLNDYAAVEGIAYSWQYGFRTTVLYELHGKINSADGLKWYVGPGAHVGFYNSTWAIDYPNRASGMSIGIDGVLGLDYKIPTVPLNVSFDWQPSFNLIGYNYFEGGWGGLGIRYTF